MWLEPSLPCTLKTSTSHSPEQCSSASHTIADRLWIFYFVCLTLPGSLKTNPHCFLLGYTWLGHWHVSVHMWVKMSSDCHKHALNGTRFYVQCRLSIPHWLAQSQKGPWASFCSVPSLWEYCQHKNSKPSLGMVGREEPQSEMKFLSLWKKEASNFVFNVVITCQGTSLINDISIPYMRMCLKALQRLPQLQNKGQ